MDDDMKRSTAFSKRSGSHPTYNKPDSGATKEMTT
jgi:hypothetical protein